MRSNIVFIDFENVQPKSLGPLASKSFRVMLFVGAKQTTLPVGTVTSFQKLGDRAEYIRISKSRRNAVDFHIAYYVGVHAAKDPATQFHIVSNDKGFDPLIEHLQGSKIVVQRVSTLDQIRSVKSTRLTTPAERALHIADKLALPQATRPRTAASLSNYIAAQFQKKLSEQEVAAVVAGLVEQTVISVVDGKINYLEMAEA